MKIFSKFFYTQELYEYMNDLSVKSLYLVKVHVKKWKGEQGSPIYYRSTESDYPPNWWAVIVLKLVQIEQNSEDCYQQTT